MPNTGKPSRDCHLCRKRRVKCDLARPACQRCIKYGAECPGYRDQQELVFRNADPTSVKKRKKRGDKADDIQELSPSPSFPTPPLLPDGDFLFATEPAKELEGLSGYRSALVLCRPVCEHWTTHSVPMLLNVYNNLDFIKNIYRDHLVDGPLTWAAHLFTRTYVTNIRYPTSMYRDSESETSRELAGYLGKTLSSVSNALKDPDGAHRDDVLATVWILANYELLIGSLTRTDALSPWHLHTRGLYSILKARGSESLYTAAGRTAFWPAYNMVQIQALISNIECPSESAEWFEIIKSTLFPREGLTLSISIFIAKVSGIQSRIISILRRRDFPGASKEYATIFAELTLAEEELDEWMVENPVIDDNIDLYMVCIKDSALVKGYHIMQLLINFLTHYPPCPIPLEQLRADRAYCMKTVHAAAEHIIESAPKAIGPLAKGKDKSPKVLFDALKMTWPLISVYVITSCRPEQRLAAEGILVYIGKELGVRQALNTYPGKMLLPQEAQEPLGEAVLYGESACFH